MAYVKQHQIRLDPNKLLAYNIPLSMVIDGVKASTNERSHSSHPDLGEGCCGQVADICNGDDRAILHGRESSRNTMGNGISENVVWYVIRNCA